MFYKHYMHQKGFASLLIILILLVGILGGLYLIQHPQIFKPKAYEANISQVTSLTNQLVASNSKEIASERYQALLDLARKDPQSFFKLATLADKADTFPLELRRFIEEKVNITGELALTHLDNFESHQKSQQIFSVANYDLNFSSSFPLSIAPGTQVKVEGVALGPELFLSKEVQPVGGKSPAPTRDEQLGEQKVAVILFEFNDPSSEKYTKEEIEDYMFNGDLSVRSYYDENSYNKLHLTGEVFGPYKIDFDSQQYCGELHDPNDPFYRIRRGLMYSWWFAAQKAAKEAGFDPQDYEHVVFVASQPTSCSIDGIGAPTSSIAPKKALVLSLKSGFDQVKRRNIFIMTTAHELGHNLGVNHANVYDCKGKSIDNYRNCSDMEYMDYSDTMGLGFTDKFEVDSKFMQFNAPHKLRLGWIPQNQVQVVQESGEYQLRSLEEDSPEGIKILKIPIKIVGDNDPVYISRFYYLSYRRAVGLDHNMRLDFDRALSIHYMREITVEDQNGEAVVIEALSYLINTWPENGLDQAYYNAPLSLGRSFFDPFNDLRVTLVKHDDEAATVRIDL